MSTPTPVAPKATLVTTAEGDVVKFTGFIAKLIVAHPRLATAIFFAIGLFLGHVGPH